MSPVGKLRKKPLLLGLVLVALGRAGSASDAAAGALPKDPCALLNPAEIQALAPSATIGSGVADSSMAPIGTGCTFRWGPKTPEWGESSLTFAVIDASKGWPGMSPELLKQGLRTKVKMGAPHASLVSGLGDVAVFTFEERSSNATVEAYFQARSVHLSVTLHAGDSLSSKGKLAALLKGAAARL